METFTQHLRRIQEAKSSALCVGLDPDLRRIPSHLLHDRTPAEAVVVFCRAIVEATEPYACAFKVNVAFFEVLGAAGAEALATVLRYVPRAVLTVADAKRGDIGNSARFYAEAVYEGLGCDAVTVAPYMGRDSVTPFLEAAGRCAFVLARTSNPGAADFQERLVDGVPLYLHVARAASSWGDESEGEVGLVVGATAPEALDELRTACPDAPFLIPGVGAQGGDPAAVMDAAATRRGRVLVNASRSILYASAGRDFAAAAGEEAAALRDALRHPTLLGEA